MKKERKRKKCAYNKEKSYVLADESATPGAIFMSCFATAVDMNFHAKTRKPHSAFSTMNIVGLDSRNEI
jgi:hypothetical protein